MLNGAFGDIFEQTTLSSATIRDLTVVGNDPKFVLANVYLDRQSPKNNFNPYRPLKTKRLVPVSNGSRWHVCIKGQKYVWQSMSPLSPSAAHIKGLIGRQYFSDEISFNPLSNLSHLPQAAENLINPFWWISSIFNLLDSDPAPSMIELNLKQDKLVKTKVDPLAFMFASKIPGIAGVNKRLAEITAVASLLLAMHPKKFEEIAKSIEIGSKAQDVMLRVFNPKALALIKQLQEEWKDALKQGLFMIKARGDIDANTREIIDGAGGRLFQGI